MDWLNELLQRPAVSWTDLLDIALVSFLVYELLLLIRGTRAAQMALSGLFIIGLYFLSRWLQLETVNWVIRNLAGYVVFAIIVLFQSDIRRALEDAARSRRRIGHHDDTGAHREHVAALELQLVRVAVEAPDAALVERFEERHRAQRLEHNGEILGDG